MKRVVLHCSKSKNVNFSRIKIPGLNDRNASCIHRIQRAFRSLERGSFHVSPNLFFWITSGIAALLFTVPLSALTLEEAEHRALKTNIAIQLTDQDLKQYDSRHLQAILSWLPEVTFGSMYAKLQKSQKISHLQRQNHLF